MSCSYRVSNKQESAVHLGKPRRKITMHRRRGRPLVILYHDITGYLPVEFSQFHAVPVSSGNEKTFPIQAHWACRIGAMTDLPEVFHHVKFAGLSQGKTTHRNNTNKGLNNSQNGEGIFCPHRQALPKFSWTCQQPCAPLTDRFRW